MTTENQLAVKNQEISQQQLNYKDPAILKLIREIAAPNSTDTEFDYFKLFCMSTGLNPLKKEIWFTKIRGKVNIMTGINGFRTIANKHPMFDGTEWGVERDPKTNKPIKAWAKVWRKDRRFPGYGEAWFNEYYRTGKDGPSAWDTNPTAMLEKVAESLASRMAFPNELNGLYTEEEMINVTEPNPQLTARFTQKDLQTEIPINLPAPSETINWAEHPKTMLDRVKGKDATIEPRSDTASDLIPQTVPDTSGIAWDKFPYRYHLPYQSKSLDMGAIRGVLKQVGAKFRRQKILDKETGNKYYMEGGDDHWYSPVEVPEIAQYLRPEYVGQKQEPALEATTSKQIIDADDDLPDWMKI